MKLERFLAERSGDWSELEALLTRAGVVGSKLGPDELRRLGTLYRSAAADLAVARRSFPDTGGTRRLQALVVTAYGVVYSRADRTETPREFLSHGLWRRIRENIGCVGIAAAIMFGCTALGALWALADPASAIGILPAGFHVAGRSFHGGFYGISVPARAGLAVGIFVNNIAVAFLALAGGFTFGLLTAYSLAYNGALLGVLGTFEWRGGGFDEFVRLIVPHGLLELSCISLAGGAGLAIARALIDPGRRTRSDALARLVPVIGACTLGAVIFLVVAGLTEGFVTPWNLPTVPAVLLGVLLAGSFWAMVTFRGGVRSAARRRATRVPAV
ncbi:MAG TPA: stage II sporulation protein M [Acidimicrobiales bacterium]|nr:stage II sporulation protein M [Acidimicrobiales bacterium]